MCNAIHVFPAFFKRVDGEGKGKLKLQVLILLMQMQSLICNGSRSTVEIMAKLKVHVLWKSEDNKICVCLANC